jgi:hypothetical protein
VTAAVEAVSRSLEPAPAVVPPGNRSSSTKPMDRIPLLR